MRVQKRFIVIALLFGLAIGSIPPYPNTYADAIWLVSAAIYFLVSLIPSDKFRNFWLQFGIATFTLMLIAIIWFFHLTMMYNFWFPPDILPIIQHFYRVDGEASYDALVSNLFFIMWLLVTIVLAVRHLTSSSKPTSGN
jgi:hypothetical protein